MKTFTECIEKVMKEAFQACGYEEKFGKGVGSIKDICKHIKDNVTDEEIQKCLETVTKLKEYFMKVKDGRNK